MKGKSGLSTPMNSTPAVPSKTDAPGCYGNNPMMEGNDKKAEYGPGDVPLKFFDESIKPSMADISSTMHGTAALDKRRKK